MLVICVLDIFHYIDLSLLMVSFDKQKLLILMLFFHYNFFLALIFKESLPKIVRFMLIDILFPSKSFIVLLSKFRYITQQIFGCGSAKSRG